MKPLLVEVCASVVEGGGEKGGIAKVHLTRHLRMWDVSQRASTQK